MEKGKIVFLRTCSRPVPRVTRMMKVAEDLGFDVIFIGAFREKGIARDDQWEGHQVLRRGVYYPLLNGKRLFKYLWGVLSYNIHTAYSLFKLKPKLVHISDIESFLAGFIYTKLKRRKIIYNIHDNLAQRYEVNSNIQKILNKIEGFAIKHSFATMVPEEFRKSALPKLFHDKIHVVKNMPAHACWQEPPKINTKSDIIIFYAGWIDSDRGIDLLLKLSNVLPNVKIVCAGEGNDGLLQQLKSKENIDYLGFIDHKTILQHVARSHFIFAYYKPNRIINRYAAPNKLAESLGVGRPVIINQEVILSRKVKQNHCGIVEPYESIDIVAKEISKLSNNPEEYHRMCHNARLLFEAEYSWEVTQKSCSNMILNSVRN